MFIYFNLCPSVMLDSLSCSTDLIHPSFLRLTRKTWYRPIYRSHNAHLVTRENNYFKLNDLFSTEHNNMCSRKENFFRTFASWCVYQKTRWRMKRGYQHCCTIFCPWQSWSFYFIQSFLTGLTATIISYQKI
jgi:hypothetical protein